MRASSLDAIFILPLDLVLHAGELTNGGFSGKPFDFVTQLSQSPTLLDVVGKYTARPGGALLESLDLPFQAS